MASPSRSRANPTKSSPSTSGLSRSTSRPRPRLLRSGSISGAAMYITMPGCLQGYKLWPLPGVPDSTAAARVGQCMEWVRAARGTVAPTVRGAMLMSRPMRSTPLPLSPDMLLKSLMRESQPTAADASELRRPFGPPRPEQQFGRFGPHRRLTNARAFQSAREELWSARMAA